MNFRDLNKNEIYARIDRVSEKSIHLCLYKDARVDMAILNETVGMLNWSCSYRKIEDSLFCEVSIYDKEKNMWISKEDCGEKSFADEKKGEASDAFKRACYKWGIGVELYNTPDIFFFPKDNEVKKNKSDKLTCYTKFHVKHIKIENKEVTELIIVDDKYNERYRYGEIIDEKQKKIDFSICAEPKSEHYNKKWVDMPLDALEKALEYYKTKHESNYVYHIDNAIKSIRAKNLTKKVDDSIHGNDVYDAGNDMNSEDDNFIFGE